MRNFGYILVTLFLISSCGKHDFISSDQESQNRSKKDLRRQEEVKKTPGEALNEKLNAKEIQGLNFLKEALDDDSNFNKFLSHDESNIKFALKHINDELAKCTGDNANEQKKTFKQIVKGSFESNSNDLDKFKEQAASTCGAGG